ncbi:hypothetical protein M885DRAFT_616689 [Pelagophyceae sp. CCMP2097]|nr:hypothetical protein M885DRAFT_616689 [Pelagophyceae sp. CCMP2097]
MTLPSSHFYVGAEQETDMKPVTLVELIEKELKMDLYGIKPLDAVSLVNARLNREAGTGSAKEELQACRAVVRALSPAFWCADTVGLGNNSSEALVKRLLAKPASCGGFAAAVCVARLNAKAIDTKAIFASGALTIDGIALLRPPGLYSTLDSEMENLSRLFGTQRDAEKLGDASFGVVSRDQVSPGTSVMLLKAKQCNCKLAALQTPKFCLVGLYTHAGPDAEAATLKLFEDLRLEASKPHVPPAE